MKFAVLARVSETHLAQSRSADFQSALSPICNRQGAARDEIRYYFERSGPYPAERIKNPRYSRLKICATVALLTLVASNFCPAAIPTPPPQPVAVKKIWDAAPHNAFTDLIRFQDKWLCTFRESEAHVGGNGKIRVLTSTDGDHWDSAALLTEEGIDLRDPKLSITPDNRLMLVMGGSVYAGKVLKERQSRVAFSTDGSSWSAPKRVLDKGDWLWRVTWFKGQCYGIAYFGKADESGSTLKFVQSRDGEDFQLVTKLEVPGHANESTVRFSDNGDCIALVRRETQDKQAWIGESQPPYKNWKWHPAGMQIGGPNFILLPNGLLIASGRQYGATQRDAKTFVGSMSKQSVTSQIILPSGGDCSYPGMVWHNGLLWVSYYSSHEGKGSIYLAKLRLPAMKR